MLPCYVDANLYLLDTLSFFVSQTNNFFYYVHASKTLSFCYAVPRIAMTHKLSRCDGELGIMGSLSCILSIITWDDGMLSFEKRWGSGWGIEYLNTLLSSHTILVETKSLVIIPETIFEE